MESEYFVREESMPFDQVVWMLLFSYLLPWQNLRYAFIFHPPLTPKQTCKRTLTPTTIQFKHAQSAAFEPSAAVKLISWRRR